MDYPRFVDQDPVRTPARIVDIDAWPKRDSVAGASSGYEWFDWSELFIERAPQTLLRVCRVFGTQLMRIACLVTDDPADNVSSLRVIEIHSDNLSSGYFKAIWDDQSTSFGRLGAVARIVLVWDSKDRWLIINDRFYEIGVFIVLEDDRSSFRSSGFFNQLDQEELVSRFSRILRVETNRARTEVERWI